MIIYAIDVQIGHKRSYQLTSQSEVIYYVSSLVVLIVTRNATTG